MEEHCAEGIDVTEHNARIVPKTPETVVKVGKLRNVAPT